MPAAPLRLALAIGLTTSVGLAGCAQAQKPTPARDGVIRVEQHDYRFRPAALRASSGRVRIEVVNRGRLPHALRLTRDGRERLRIPTMLPGERASATARLEAGTYRMLCPIANHEELGMYGSVTVR